MNKAFSFEISARNGELARAGVIRTPHGEIATPTFVVVAFAGVISSGQLVGLSIIAYLTKMLGETILLPLTYQLVKRMKKITAEEHYDKRLYFKDVFIK
jgi:tRNA-guanine family transglycosylase